MFGDRREAALSPSSGRYPDSDQLFHRRADGDHDFAPPRRQPWFLRDLNHLRNQSRTDRMKIPALPFTVTDWDAVAPTLHPGESGQAIWRTFNIGDLRVRHVEYSAGYLADHWCDRGHVLYVLEGELDTELRDGRTFKLKPGMSYQVSDHGDAAHRSSTATGAKLFIVD
jgi:hypothetical protein